MDEPVCRDVYRGEKLALQVLDRHSARQCVHAEPYAVISITDPELAHPTLKSDDFRRGVLRLTFSDVEERFALARLKSPHLAAFTKDMARQVAGFVREQFESGTRLLVIHCEAGMSRSAGMATALSQFYNQDETFFLVHYKPSGLVRRLVLEALAPVRPTDEQTPP